MTPKENIENLIREMQNGSTEAKGRLYLELQKFGEHALKATVFDPVRRSRCVEETLEEFVLAEAPKILKATANPISYYKTCLVNNSKDQKREAVHIYVGHEEVQPSESEFYQDPLDELLEEEELRKAIDTVDQFTPAQKEILDLLMRGLSYEQVAQKTQVTINTVYKQVQLMKKGIRNDH